MACGHSRSSSSSLITSIRNLLPGRFIGVDVFFVLSGYLITYLLLGEHDKYDAIDLRRFYLRRAFRLYPALLTTVLVVGVVSAIDGIGRPIPDSFFAATYLTDLWANVKPEVSLLAHTWPLAVEEQFYLVWPAVLSFALRRKWRLEPLVCCLIALSLIFTFGLHEAHIGRLNIQYLPTSHVAELGAGILLAIQARRGIAPLTRRLGAPAVAVVALGRRGGRAKGVLVGVSL